MSEMLLDMEADQVTASAIEKMDNAGLSSVAEIGREIVNTQDLVAELDEKLKEAKRHLLKLTDEDLPAMLAELGLNAIELDDGSKVTVQATYGAHIKVDNREEAFQWLRDNDYGDIIKNTVTCAFARGEDQQAAEFKEAAERMGYIPEQKTEVHAGTLKAWVKERVENGDSFPMDLFGAYTGQRAKIARSK